ncbi:MAG: permease [Methanosarcinaceae archaeon]|nr:permease [Methanosarcinaceae archaeon]
MLLDELYVIFQLIRLQFRLFFFYWFFGVLIGAFITTFATDWISDALCQIQQEENRFSLGSIGTIVLASVLGAASPVCMYGTIPIIISLGKKGVASFLLVPFMVSSILINPNLFFFSFALGTPLALLRLAAALSAGICAGVFTGVFFREKKLLNYEGLDFGEGCTFRKKKFAFFFNFHEIFVKTGVYFLAGLTLTALFERYFPKEILLSLLGNQSHWGVLIAISIGVPLYVCGGGTIPILSAWLEAGMNPGAAIAFLLAGPATKINNLAALKMVLGVKNFIIYLLFSLTFAGIVGLLISRIY